jgi:hypothetical protein
MAKLKPRYVKQRKTNNLKKARNVRRMNWIQKKNPNILQIDKDSKMKSIFSQNRNHSRALILDVDGTICEFLTGKRKHRTVQFRPHFAEFLSKALEFSDLFIFSSMDIIRLRNLWKKHFSKQFSGYFDKSLLMKHKKNIDPILNLGSDILLIDDSPKKIHPRCTSIFLPISRWKDDEKDCELLLVLSEIKRRWSLEGSDTKKEAN